MSDKDGEKTMTFWEHLDELRIRLRRIVLVYVILCGAAWYAREYVLVVLVFPFKKAWVEQGLPGTPQLHFAAPSDAFMAYVKQSMIAGAVVAAPFILWQVWAFIAPGLYAKEKKTTAAFVFFSTLLFVSGGVFAWRVAFPLAFSYFLGLAGNLAGQGVGITPTVMMTDYLSFVGRLLIAFGVIFEIPLVSLFLSATGIVNYKQMWRFGRWFVLIAFIIGAAMTPPDIASQLVMAVPMCGLYLVSIGLAYVFGKRPPKEEPEKAEPEPESDDEPKAKKKKKKKRKPE